MLISSSDFINWKQDPVTTVVMNELNNKISTISGRMLGDPRNDIDAINWQRGYVAALVDILSLEAVELDEVADA